MSAFLGPIHFWLYNKINNQEELTKKTAIYAKDNGWIDDPERYTEDLPPLKSVIDEDNIHGWLQRCINDAESRFSDLICTVSDDNKRMEDILGIAFDYGKAHRVEKAETATDVYRYFEDYFLNGMPCDRVNVVTAESQDELSWQMEQDIHARYWSCGTDVYYMIRKEVMKGMLDGTCFAMDSPDNAHYIIKKQ